MSDINDVYEPDDPDVIEIKQAIALPPLDLARVAANIMRVADADHGGDADADADADAVADADRHDKYVANDVFDRDDRDRGGDDRHAVGTDIPAPPSSGSRDLAAMLMFDYVEAER
jgi:hypothetical protein